MLRKSGTPQTFTPAKSNIDTTNDGVSIISPFNYGNFGYPCYFSGVMVGTAVHGTTIFLPASLWRRWWNSLKGKWRNDTFTQASPVRVFGDGKGCQEGLKLDTDSLGKGCRKQDVGTYISIVYIYIYIHPIISYTSPKANMLNPKPWRFGSDDFPGGKSQVFVMDRMVETRTPHSRAAGNLTKIRLFWSKTPKGSFFGRVLGDPFFRQILVGKIL